MRTLILLFTLLLLSSCGGKHTGTGTDVQSGSIAGILYDGNHEVYKEEVIIELYEREVRPSIYLEEQTIDEGEFTFESLASGPYKVKVVEDSIVIGEKNMDIVEGEDILIEIEVRPVVQKTIPDTIEYNGEMINIENIIFQYGKIDMSNAGEIVLTFGSYSSLFLQFEYLDEGVLKEFDANLVKQSDGSYLIVIVE